MNERKKLKTGRALVPSPASRRLPNDFRMTVIAAPDRWTCDVGWEGILGDEPVSVDILNADRRARDVWALWWRLLVVETMIIAKKQPDTHALVNALRSTLKLQPGTARGPVFGVSMVATRSHPTAPLHLDISIASEDGTRANFQAVGTYPAALLSVVSAVMKVRPTVLSEPDDKTKAT